VELTEVIHKRKMTRNYRDEPVDIETVRRIVALGRRGPSAGFTQGVYFVVITDSDTRREIARIADEDRYVASGLPPWVSTAAVHVVVCVSEADYHARYREPDKLNEDGTEIDWPIPYWWTDAGACLMLLLLAVVNEGLAAGFFGVHRLTGLNQLLGVPEDVTPIGVVTIGHAAKDQPSSSARRGWKPLDDVVRWERW
jgi:FMN reductase [NAD(P)H]